MESQGEPNKIQVTESVYQLLKNGPFVLTQRGQLNIKGKGLMKTYFLNNRLA